MRVCRLARTLVTPRKIRTVKPGLFFFGLLDEGCLLLFGAGGGALFLDLGHAEVEVVEPLGVFGLLAADGGEVSVIFALDDFSVLVLKNLHLNGVGAFVFAGFLFEGVDGLDVLLLCHCCLFFVINIEYGADGMGRFVCY